jgi:hypothetical protein
MKGYGVRPMGISRKSRKRRGDAQMEAARGVEWTALSHASGDNECHCFELFARFRPDRCGVDGCRNSPLETTVPQCWVDSTWFDVVTQQHSKAVGGVGATLRTLEARSWSGLHGGHREGSPDGTRHGEHYFSSSIETPKHFTSHTPHSPPAGPLGLPSQPPGCDD